MMIKNENEDPKITVTPNAAKKFLNMMVEKGLDGQYVRVFVDGLRCSGVNYGLAFSKEPREDDRVIEVNGIRILVDEFNLVFLNGLTIDFVNTPKGPDFILNNPNEVKI